MGRVRHFSLANVNNEEFKIKNVKLMIEDANSLEMRGLLRRSMTVWQSIAIDTTADDEERNLAWQKIVQITSLQSQKIRQESECIKRASNKMNNVDTDRQQVITYLKKGLSPKEIKTLTYRSDAFIYGCKKYL
ncbi:hypothetical protein [Buttiauxella izardii]|uniref:hypothetical protein n=1 Tax=Buttiauxella izardii TaxID=82991 RepID=UPI0011C226F2|nr:hypothetical protein [Buttiauxella izardii]